MNRSSIADNAGFYNKKIPIQKTQVEPDAVAYSSQFYAPHHIPSYQERPGNNTIKQEVYARYVTKEPIVLTDNLDGLVTSHVIQPSYNLYCYSNKSTPTLVAFPADTCWQT